MNIIRVFARQTKATPIDDLAFYDEPGLFVPEADEVHVSCTFTEDLPRAEWLAKSWERVGLPVKIGGPAFDEPGGNFVSGRYLKQGYVITSRGCPNNCWYCSVTKREGPQVRELPVVDGWNLLDDNLLRCSESHIKSVFKMLSKYRNRAEFTGGLESKMLKPWHVDLLAELNPKQMFFAYDRPESYEPLRIAGQMLMEAGFTDVSKRLRCYVLIGYPKDTLSNAEKRLRQTREAGFWPMAMLWKHDGWIQTKDWKKLQREWARPALMVHK